MTMNDEQPSGRKAPYVSPVLAGLDLFGAEASFGSCCRESAAACTTSSRSSRAMTLDGSKAQTSVNS